MAQSVSKMQSGVCFDPDAICLMGIYNDELSVFRARKRWSHTLEISFSLKESEDFSLETFSDIDGAEFRLMCKFNSPCGRYAFWRLTNAQAPEAQYEIETAHIPDCPSKNIDMVLAPDLASVLDTPLVIRGSLNYNDPVQNNKGLLEYIKKWFRFNK